MTAVAAPLEKSSIAPPWPHKIGAVTVLVLSTDPALRAVVQTAVTERHEYRQVESADAAVDTLLSHPCGVLVADLAVVRGDVAALFTSLREQFPDLALIAAGSRDDEVALEPLISSGALFRFLHKPASPARTNVYVNEAIERHTESAGGGLLRLLATPGTWRLTHWLLLLLVLAIGIGTLGWWLVSREAVTPVPQARAPVAAADDSTELLTRARTALQEGRLVAPAGDNALDLFTRVLGTAPDEPEALDGVRRVVDRLLTEAEDALAAGDVERAGRALQYVRSAKPEHPRLHFLDAQLARAEAAIEAARRAAVAPEATPQQVEIRRLLELADQRLASGRLIDSPRNDARHYVLAALRIDARDPEVRSVIALTGAALVERGESALESGDIDQARHWSAAAADFAREARTKLRGLDDLEGRIDTVTRRHADEQAAEHLAAASQRLDDGAWIEPMGDSARDHLIAARSRGADAVALAPLEQRLLTGLVDSARTAIQDGELDSATDWIEAARRLAPADDTVAEVGVTLAAARARRAFFADVIPAATLQRTRATAPKYPREAARRGIAGHVELTFTVARDGSTREFEVVESDPAKVFEEAAIAAVQEWRFEPVMRNGEAVDQRASVRIKFQLEDE